MVVAAIAGVVVVVVVDVVVGMHPASVVRANITSASPQKHSQITSTSHQHHMSLTSQALKMPAYSFRIRLNTFAKHVLNMLQNHLNTFARDLLNRPHTQLNLT